MTPGPDSDRPKGSRGALSTFLLAAIPSVVFNWFSSLFQPAAPLVLLGLFVAFVVVILSESAKTDMQIPALERFKYLQQAKLGVGAILLGAIIAGLWLLPIWPAKRFDFDPAAFYWLSDIVQQPIWPNFYNYEAGAVICLLLMGVVAMVRGTRLVDVMAFGVGAMGGMSLVVSYVRPKENDFTLTFLSWAAVFIVLLCVVKAAPDMLAVLLEFFGVRVAGRKHDATAKDDPAKSSGPDSSNAIEEQLESTPDESHTPN